MKKLCALTISLILVASLWGCSLRFEVRNNGRTEVKTYETTSIDEEIVFGDEDYIRVDVKCGEVNLQSYEGENIIISGRTNRGNNIINIDKTGSTIYIKDIGSGDVFNSYYGTGVIMEVDIKIPKDFKGDIKIAYGAGSLDIKDLECKNMDIEVGAGELTVRDIVFEKLSVNGGVGTTDINLSKKSGKINISGGVGETFIELAEVGGDFSYEGGVGTAEIKIPKNAPVYFKTSSGLGSTDISAITSGEETYKFDISVGIGAIEIYN